ncbi:hypothetical protein GCM10009837_69910 [Streptomyces durmitorensis]|uniref:Integral membrane protein n=1 Tax=Streptomyces durmitorensis TaxID=319947 RepID=A0ABY4PUK1_9ACTN|nr:hypothetical protein [Streptomyces durmitorensis]UQT56785.1 hypothetical protein M4V62_17720 [Streptomyces durmitorensis]
MTGQQVREKSTQRMTGYDRRMLALMNRREAAPMYATAVRRRLAVGAHITLTVASVAAWLLTVVGDQRWAMWTMLGLLLPWCVATGVINGATRGLLELRERALDERQRAERVRVAARARQVMQWLLLAAAVGAGIAAYQGWGAEGLLFPVLFTAFVVHWLMPLWVAGLAVQDEPADLDPEGLDEIP